MESPEAYIPIDRRWALAQGHELPEHAIGTALFADISGFTPLTEALVQALGPQRGAETLPQHLNAIYDALIAAVDRYGGSVIGFSGDAITCWFDATANQPHAPDQPSAEIRAARRAAACAHAMQQAMTQFAAISIAGGAPVALAIKAALASGPVRRFVVGDPAVQRIDVLAGATLERLASAEHAAAQGEIVVDNATRCHLHTFVQIVEEREGAQFAVIDALHEHVAPIPWPMIDLPPLPSATIAPWLLPPVHERLRSGLGEFLTELRPAVPLFLRFTGIEYDHDPAAGAKLDAFVRWVQGVLARYGGFLIQLTIGDKGSYLYAAWGAPVAHADDAIRAAHAALELRQPPQHLAFVQQVQMGMSQGRMRTGAYGSATRRTYGVLGDDVNLAARLMQHAAHGQVIVSRAAQQMTGRAFVWETLPPVRVKGKRAPVEILRLAGPVERAARLQEPRYTLPIVGRGAERQVIEQKIVQARNGAGQIIALTAEAGMGKSRLVAETVQAAQAHGMDVVIGECQSYGTNTSYGVWENVWQQFFGLDPAAPLAVQITHLEAQLAALDPAFVPRLPLLGVALNLLIPDNDLTRSLDAKLRKASLEALLVDCTRARAGEPFAPLPKPHRSIPTMFVLEDCHWIDPLSHDLVEAIGRAIADVPVIIVVAYRPPEVERLQAPRVTQLPWCTTIELTDFRADEAAQLIALKLRQLTGAEVDVSAALVQHIMARTQGNPFYIEELLNYLHDRGIDPRDGTALAQLDLPTTLHSLVLSRIDQLSENQKVTIKVASVVGRMFQYSWLWGAHPQLGEHERVKADLDTMGRLDLTPLDQPEPELTYLFKHIITREVAYESLPFATRSVLHGQLGAFIEARYAAVVDQYLDLLAYHYDLSPNAAKKQEFLCKAGAAAQAAYANTAAIDYYRRVLPLLPPPARISVMLDLGQVLELVGNWDEAGEYYAQAWALSMDNGDQHQRARCQMARGKLLRKRGDYREAEGWLRQALDLCDALGDTAGASQALEAIGEVYRLRSEYAAAQRYYTRSLQLAGAVNEAHRSKALRATALKGAGALAIHHGDYPAAHRAYRESLVLLRELGDKPSIASVLSNLGIVVQHEGDYDHARELGEEGLALRRELGDRWGIAVSLGNLGMVARLEKKYLQAIALYEECLAIYRQLGERNYTALVLNNLGDVAVEQQEYAQARALYEEGLTIQREVGDQWAIAYLLEAFAALAAAEAQPERAVRLAGFAAALRQTIGAPLAPAEQTQLDQSLAAARKTLGDIGAGACAADGAALTLEQAIAVALQPAARK